MERPKHRRFILLGLVLLAGGMLLLGRHWFSSNTEPSPAPSSAVAVRPVETQLDEVQPLAVETATSAASTAPPAPAATTGGFRGRIIDAVTRRPVKEFEVRLIRIQRGDVYREEPPLTQTFQSETGRFAWKDIAAASYIAAISAPGYQQFDLGKLGIVAGKTTREVIMPLLRGYAVRGRVFERSTGAGIADAWVTFRETSSRHDEGGSQAPTKSKDDGSFVLDGVPGGDITLMVGANEHGSRELEIVVDEKTTQQEIALSTGGTIAGTVTTAAGTPVKARVMLFDSSTGNMDETNDAGQFSFKHLRAGRYRVAASGSGGSGRQDIILAEDERKDDIVLAFAPGRSVRGVVRGLRPEELQRTRLGLNASLQSSVFLQSRPDERGAYVFNGVPSGRARLSVLTEGRQLINVFEVPADQDVALDIVFPPGVRLSGRVTQGGKPAGQRMIWIGPVEPRSSGTQYRATTSEDGQYEVEGIVPGDYRLTADEDVRRPLSIAGDTVLNIDIPSVQLGGSVQQDGGSVPIVGAHVYVRGTEPATTRVHGQTDDFGHFKLIGIEPGEVVLTVYKPGYELYREKISYASPITKKTITLRKGGGAEVRVQRAPGKEEQPRGFMLIEMGPENRWGIDLWIPLDREGVGYLPSGLAGSTFQVFGFSEKPIVIEAWDGQSLELKL